MLDKYQYFLQEDLVAITGREIFFAEGTVESILRHRLSYKFLLDGKKENGWYLLANLPKETLAHNAKMVFAPDVDEDYDAEIVIGK